MFDYTVSTYHRRLALFVGLLLLAFALRTAGLNTRSLWFDESIEYWMAAVPLAEVHQAVAQATHDPPLYSYLLHFWQQLGLQEFWLRLPALFASMIGIVGTAVLATRAFNRQVGFVTALLLTIAAADIRYAQEVGQYALMVAFVAWNLLFLYMAYKQDRWRWWLLWGGTAVLSIYTHYGAAIVTFATGLVILLNNARHRRWGSMQKQIIVGVLAVLLILPLVIVIIPQQMGRLGATMQPFSLRQLVLISARILVFHFTGNEGIMRWPWVPLPNWLPAIPILLAMLFVIGWKAGRMPPLWLVITWVVYYLVGLTGTYFFIGARHALLLSPLIMVTLAAGLHTVWRFNRPIAVLLLLPILAASLLIPREAQEDLRTAVLTWQSEMTAGDVTYIYYGAAPGFRYQLDVQDRRLSSLPRQWYYVCWRPDDDAPFCAEDNIYYGNWTRNYTPEKLRQSMASTLGEWPPRLWLIFSHVHQTENETFMAALEELYEVSYHQAGEGADLYLLTKR